MTRFRKKRSQNPWQRVDEQRGDHKFSGPKRADYSGYYGDANSREHLGTNRFGSNRVPHYNDNRYLDHDDNFINHEVSDRFDRNIGSQVNLSDNLTNNMDRTYASRGFRGKGPKGWKRSDERIKEDVNEALFKSYAVDATDIEVDVQDGVVYLRGNVHARGDKREAEDCVEHIPGVVDVQNQLRFYRVV